MANQNFATEEDFEQCIKDGCYINLDEHELPEKVEPYFAKVGSDLLIPYNGVSNVNGTFEYNSARKVILNKHQTVFGDELEYHDTGEIYVPVEYTRHSEIIFKITEDDLGDELTASIIENFFQLRRHKYNLNLSISGIVQTASYADRYTSSLSGSLELFYGPKMNYPFIMEDKRFYHQPGQIQSETLEVPYYILPRGRGLHADDLNGKYEQQGFGYLKGSGTGTGIRIYDDFDLWMYRLRRPERGGGADDPEHSVDAMLAFTRGGFNQMIPRICELHEWTGGYDEDFQKITEQVGWGISIQSIANFQLSVHGVHPDGWTQHLAHALHIGNYTSDEFFEGREWAKRSNYNHNISYEFLGKNYNVPCNITGFGLAPDDQLTYAVSGSKVDELFEIDS